MRLIDYDKVMYDLITHEPQIYKQGKVDFSECYTYLDAEEIVRKQPPVKAIVNHTPTETKWISCNAQLPTKYDRYLVTCITPYGERVDISYYFKKFGWVITNDYGYKVIAWQPLQAVYKEKE